MKNMIIFLIFVSLIYIYFSFIINKNLFYSSDTCYYNYLLDAFFHKRLNIITDFTHDLSFYQNKFYLYWGHAPSLFILPFYILGGIKTSDIIYTLIAGIINIIVFYFLILEIKKFFKIKVSNFDIFFIILNFSLITPNFYLSLAGRIWHTSQIIAIFIMFFIFLF